MLTQIKLFTDSSYKCIQSNIYSLFFLNIKALVFYYTDMWQRYWGYHRLHWYCYKCYVVKAQYITTYEGISIKQVHAWVHKHTHTHKCVFFTSLQEVWVPCVQGMCRVRCWRGGWGGKILLSVCLRLPQYNCQPHMWSCVITPIGQPQTLRLPNYFHQSCRPTFGVATTDTHLWATMTSSSSLSLSISIISIKKDCNGGLLLATHLVI